MIEEGWIDLLITAAVMGGETRGQRLIAELLDKKAEQGRGEAEGRRWPDEQERDEEDVSRVEDRMKEDGGRRLQRKRRTDVSVDAMRKRSVKAGEERSKV